VLLAPTLIPFMMTLSTTALAYQVVDQLLDLSQIEGRPHYEMASEVPLVLWEAAYHNIEWTYDAGTFLHSPL